ncbi:MAG: NAD/NADP octopine/nopaline dehydrogenase family protein [Desulfobacteraceae bacterium]|jgi:opine dehydrogenase
MAKFENGPKFAVLGTGNSGQAYAADISLKGYSVNLAEISGFEETLRAIEKKGGIELSGKSSSGFAELNMITTDLAAAVKGVDIIIIGGSAFAHEPFSRAVASYFEDGQFIMFTSNFGAIRFYSWVKEFNISADVTPVETMSLLYATRALEPGNVVIKGVKGNLPVAALPASRTQAFVDKIAPIFPQMVVCENVLVTSLNNLNPIVHPPMVLCNAGRIEATGGKGWNLYGDGATESVAKLMLALDDERMSLMEHIGVQGVAFKDAFEKLYKNYSLGGESLSLSETLRKSPIHSDPAFSAPESIDTRYIAEDLPFGLVPWSSIGRMFGLPTPTIKATIQIASIMLGRNYFEEGLTAKNLGIDGMSPEDLKSMVS